jgi:hypothetical protein
MAENHVLLETIELSQTATSVTFDNIPQTGYTDLRIVASTRASDANVISGFTFRVGNGTVDTAANYFYKELTGDGTNASSSGGTVSALNSITSGASATSNTFGSLQILIPNYTSSNQKTMSVDAVSENNATSAQQRIQAWRWAGTSAINIITFAKSSDNFVAGSTFSLYAVAQLNTTPVTAPFATGGNIVANDGTYWYHAFLNSGTFTPLKALSCDALVIGGGGAGASKYGGSGGGAGGVSNSAQTLVSGTAYAITIGAGGAGVSYGPTSGPVGTSSSFVGTSTVTSAGGQGGQIAGGSIGNGIGGSSGSPTISVGGNGYVYAGGYSEKGGGGGGAGGAGASPTFVQYGVAGNGGAGVSTYSTYASATSTGVSGFYAGGGSGGGARDTTAGTTTGGGGVGGQADSVGGAATANTGGGGGGGGGNNSSGKGASGLVIVRYLMV